MDADTCELALVTGSVEVVETTIHLLKDDFEGASTAANADSRSDNSLQMGQAWLDSRDASLSVGPI